MSTSLFATKETTQKPNLESSELFEPWAHPTDIKGEGFDSQRPRRLFQQTQTGCWMSFKHACFPHSATPQHDSQPGGFRRHYNCKSRGGPIDKSSLLHMNRSGTLYLACVYKLLTEGLFMLWRQQEYSLVLGFYRQLTCSKANLAGWAETPCRDAAHLSPDYQQTVLASTLIYTPFIVFKQ